MIRSEILMRSMVLVFCVQSSDETSTLVQLYRGLIAIHYRQHYPLEMIFDWMPNLCTAASAVVSFAIFCE